MNNKGFTLVELLAVIVILALLALLTTTSVTKLVKDAKADLSDTQIKLIKKSAQMWGAENINELPSEGNCSYLTLYDLKQYGLLDEDILDPKNNQNISNDIKIKISTDSNKMTTYEVNPSNINNCEAVYGPVCTAKTTSATANIAEGNHPQSRSDMVSKFEIALKEANETENWLTVLKDSDLVAVDNYEYLHKKVVKIKILLIKSIKTLKSKS